MSKMKWDADGRHMSVRAGHGTETTSSAAEMRNDPVQAAGAEIELPDRFARKQEKNDGERDDPTAE